MPGARLTVEQRQTIERSYRIGAFPGADRLDHRQGQVDGEQGAGAELLGSGVEVAEGGAPLGVVGQGCLRVYDAGRAQRFAEHKARRPKELRLDHGPLRAQVWQWLRADWSPRQIAESLPIEFP